MSVAVRVWLSVVLAALAAYTGFTVWRITKQQRARPVAVDLATPAQPDTALPLDLDSYEMTQPNGEPFNFSKLQGKVWIASLFYSACRHQCYNLNSTIAALQNDASLDNVQFVSITVDPADDTPLTLLEYSKGFDADARRWHFLRCNLYDVQRFGRDANVAAGYRTHTRQLVLFDQEGAQRGQFRFNSSQDIADLKTTVSQLMAADEGQASESGDATQTEVEKAKSDQP